MAHHFTHYWTNKTWFRNQEEGVAPTDRLEYLAGNLFRNRKVGPGDLIYPVTVIAGEMYLCGRMRAAGVYRAREAARLLGWRISDLRKGASDHVVASHGTAMDFFRVVPLGIVKELRFITRKGLLGLKFSPSDRLADQTLRNVRRLHEDSAHALAELLPPLTQLRLGL